ncbi:ankyrin repeat-containing domain protein [Absidia repens]|uniref:Ankyrin repeat-containing domain protein n=1 Tax=Absidia repens TaxID=90262 RepID=A0A1X2IBZ9_9FUNG|nr:ankyrin repeat-containing domain protein [Absidia repens]
MPTILSKNIGNLTAGKDNNFQLDIQTAPSHINPSIRTVEQSVDAPNVYDEDKYQFQPQHMTTPLSHQSKTPDMSPWEAAEQADIGVIRAYLDKASTKKDRTLLVNYQNPTTGATLLHLAITHTTTAKTETSSQVLAAEKDTALRLELVTLLLENGADAATCNLYNVQAIHMVPLHIPTGTLPFLDVLLDNDANINARDGDGWTPLHYAARFCQPPTLVMQALVAHGANVNATDHTSHKSCLFGLIANGDYVDCFQWMVHTAKANIQYRGQFNFIPSATVTNTMRKLHHQEQQLHIEITKQATLILQAVKYGRLGILRYLIHTPKTLNKLRSLISLEEIGQARHIIHQHLTDEPREHWELVDKEIHYLSCLLEHDPRSLMAKQSRRLNTASSVLAMHEQQRRKLTRKILNFFMKPKQLIQW